MDLISVFSLVNILVCFFGTAIGIVFGCVPGLTGTMGIVIFLPFTYNMDPIASFALLLGIYCGGSYGGSISAILIKTPGTGGAAATVLDGYPLAQKGQPSEALSLATIASTFGGLVSCAALIFIAPQLARFGLQFGPPEYFSIGLFGLSVVSSLSSKNLIKGLLCALAGLSLSFVGMDPITGSTRFTFGVINLFSGIGTGAALLGLFAMAEVFSKLDSLDDAKSGETIQIKKNKIASWSILKANWFNFIRSSVIGTIVGIIPGTGVGVASWISYNEARRASKNPEEFGKGAPAGIIAPEAANNAVTGGALVPLLTLGIPGDVTTAILIGALMIQGLTPGPQLFVEEPETVQGIYAMLIMSNIFMLILGLFAAKWFAKVLKVKTEILVPTVLMFCFVGSFAEANTIFGLGLALFMGVFGFLFKKAELSVAPVLLGLLLGEIIEPNFRRSLSMSQGDYSIFFTRPISVVMITISVLSFFLPIISTYIKNRKAKVSDANEPA